MKKTYVKPEVYFENFELSANIATGCERSIGPTVGTCWKGVEGFKSFGIFTETHSCKTTPDEYGLCYHTPTDADNIFTS